MSKFYLWSHEISGVAGSHEEPILSSELLGKAEVSYPKALWLAGRAGIEKVGRLQVAVDHALLM